MTDLISDFYRYRGIEIITAVTKQLRRFRRKDYFRLIDEQILPSTKTIMFINSGWGEIVMYYALQRLDLTFISIEKEHDKACVAQNVAEGRISNVSFFEDDATATQSMGIGNTAFQTILLDPSDKDISEYSFLNPIIIKK